jgi:predicted unusual protein kinase regulating ubiquinone biosynthesis (AarF/ABC1/UbiB family)
MSMPDDARRRIDALLEVIRRLATATPSGRIALARLASVLDLSLVPEPARERVRAELDAAVAAATEPIPAARVQEILRAAWGAPASSELDDLSPEPVATTATSQVHRAILDGDPVAVKVLRPGIATAVRQDLVVLDGLLRPLAAALPRIDAQALLGEARERILDELDFEHEAGVQRQVHRALRGVPELIVPAPVTRLSHEHVLVSEWVDGTPLTALSEQPERDPAAALLVRFVIGGVRAGIVHADANPADLLLTPDGRLAILDFGATARVSRAGADHALAAVSAFAGGDAVQLGAALAGLGVLPAERGPAALAFAAHALGELGDEAPSRLDNRALLAVARRGGTRPDRALELLLAANLPADQLWPLRALAQLVGTVAGLGATAPWRSLVAQALRDGW